MQRSIWRSMSPALDAASCDMNSSEVEYDAALLTTGISPPLR
jgi:hypothetical protein